MVKCKIIPKNDEIKDRYLELPHKEKNHDVFIEETKVELYLVTYNDFDYDEDEYVEREAKIINSKSVFKYHDVKGQMFISLESANIELEFETEDQEERFIDKDWEYESFTCTIILKGSNSNNFINYTNGDLYTLEIL